MKPPQQTTDSPLQSSKMTSYPSEIVYFETAWWIVSRGRTWGPFDYQWSTDLHGIELMYQGLKFGEICGEEEFFADLAPFRIPLSISRIAAIVAGTLAAGISAGDCRDGRTKRLLKALEEFGFGRFRVRLADTPIPLSPEDR